jgi:hypothetical protein
MISLFIYSSSYTKIGDGNNERNCAVTVIFCERSTLEMADVQGSIKGYYERNYQTEEIFVLCGKYNQETVQETLIRRQEEAFKDIPKLNADHLAQNLYLMVFDKDGKVEAADTRAIPEPEILKAIFSDGLQCIFKDRGGLIEANGSAHHFVFPSGKHSNKFLRTGNILLHSSEIFFIALHLLKFYKEKEHKKILCDTSSINTIAFALLELKRKLIGRNFSPVSVISFSSYEGIFSNKIKFFHNSLILVSSSTSGNIIEKLTKHDSRTEPGNIVILYFLGPHDLYNRHKANIICDLTYSEDNPKGIAFYDTFTKRDCVFCQKGSYPVEIKGDVFLLEKPNIRRIMLKTTDAPKGLSPFIDQFKSRLPDQDNVLKVNYKDGVLNSDLKYEVYFDMMYVLENISRYRRFKDKLDDFINQYIPNNVKHLICLPDDGSKKLAEIILERISADHCPERLPQIRTFDTIPQELGDEGQAGAAVIVASCISNGKNLLFLSRALRGFEKLKLVYFIGLSTTSDEDSRNALKSHLSQGIYGKDTHTIVEVDNFYSNNDKKDTPWLKEKDFIKDMLDTFEAEFEHWELSQLSARPALIDQSMGTDNRGLSNNLFLPTTSGTPLRLRKSFAFWTFKDYTEKVSQADVFFTMSAVINGLRHSKSNEQSLTQTEFVRNLIDPSNFHRFNDGIIQASILRAAHPQEVCYHIDDKLSHDMLVILEKIISSHASDQGEGLLEFLYAICIQKLTLKHEHLLSVSEFLTTVDHPVVKAFKYYIDHAILKQSVPLTEQIKKLNERIRELEAQLVK